MITKSGTNQFHGSAFFNYRGEELRAMDFFDKQAQAVNPSYEKPYFARQEYGGSIGGPIVKEKAFFFFAYERFRERQNVAVLPSAVPQLQAIPGNQFVNVIPQPYDDTLLTGKTDFRFNDAQTLFVRFSLQDSDSPNDQVANPATTDLSGGNTSTNKLYSLVANHTWNISPSSLNQFIFHFQDFKNEILPNAVGQTLLFPSVTIGQNANTPQATEEQKFQFRDDFNLIKGTHTMKFGTNYIHTKLDGYFYFGTQGYSLSFAQDPVAIMAGGGFNRPGLLNRLTFSDGASSHLQKIHQVAFYFQDDWKVRPNFTLNLGLRWDANIGNLPKQNENRTILILDQINHPLANAITGDSDKLLRTTPSWTEFQPRIGFAFDPWSDGKTVIRGGFGIFYDQIFQNLSLFSLTQSEPQIFQTAIDWQPPDPRLSAFIYGVTPLPPVPPTFNYSVLTVGGFGRINNPDATEPYVQKFSFGFQRELSPNMSIASDFVSTVGRHEPRFHNINPRIQRVCNAAYPGSTPTSPRCVRGANSREFDQAFVAAGLPANRLEQINMFSTNNRSTFESWATTFKYRSSKMLFNASYVLASSNAWGGQPTASYSGNGIAIVPENQFIDGEFGPTRMDERHRIVLSGVFTLPWDFQLAPIFQLASARPFSANTGFDIDGDGLGTIDRLCRGVDPAAAFAVRGNLSALQALNPLGCQQAPVNTLRSGFVLDGTTFTERSHRYFNVDLRASKIFKFGERYALNTYVDFYNIFNTENLAFGSNARLGLSVATAGSTFLQPSALFGPGFGPPVGRPFTTQFGARFTF